MGVTPHRAPEPTTMAEKTNTPKAGGITKQRAVELALKEKGWDAKPGDLTPFIKERYGVDRTGKHTTRCKSKPRKKAPAKKQAPKAAVQPAPKVPAKAAAPRAGNSRPAGFSLQDLQAVKGLIGRIGAGPLRQLI